MALKVQYVGKDNISFDVKNYGSLAGALLHLTYTQPDIIDVVQKVRQKVQQPTVGDYKTLKRITR